MYSCLLWSLHWNLFIHLTQWPSNFLPYKSCKPVLYPWIAIAVTHRQLQWSNQAERSHMFCFVSDIKTHNVQLSRYFTQGQGYLWPGQLYCGVQCSRLHTRGEDNIIVNILNNYQYCQTPVLGLGRVIDSTFYNNHNNNNNPRLNFVKETVLWDKAQGVGIRDKG